MSEGTSHPRTYPAKEPVAEAHARARSYCTACPKLCRHTCPVAEAEKRETVTPQALMQIFELEARGHLQLDASEAALAWHCTSCRACQGSCAFHNDVPGALHARRAQAYRQGEAPEAARSMVARFYERGNNLHREGLHQVVRQTLSAEHLRPDARDLILVDCVTAAHYPQVIRDLAEVLERLDLQEVGFYTGPHACCGLPLYDGGDLDGFALHARALQQSVGDRRSLTSLNPGCAHAMRDLYPQVGVSWELEVSPIIDLILPALERYREKHPEEADALEPEKLVYHHPCHLARPLNRAADPERAIALVNAHPPRETLYSGGDTECSGGGGGLPMVLPKVAERVTQKTLEHLQLAQDETLVTACPTSRRRFDQAGVPRTLDLITLIADRLRSART